MRHCIDLTINNHCRMKIKKGESRQLFWTVKTSAADNSESKQSDFVQFSVSFQPLQQRHSKWLSVFIYCWYLRIRCRQNDFWIFHNFWIFILIGLRRSWPQAKVSSEIPSSVINHWEGSEPRFEFCKYLSYFRIFPTYFYFSSFQVSDVSFAVFHQCHGLPMSRISRIWTIQTGRGQNCNAKDAQ